MPHTLPKDAPQRWLAGIIFVTLALNSGCSALTFRISGTPVEQLSSACFAEAKRDLVPIDVTILSQPAPDAYRLDEGDVLGIVVDGVLPFSPPDQPGVLPPVHFSQSDSTAAPAIGVPVVVQEKGIITLPILGQVPVAGLTLSEAADKLKQGFDKADALRSNASYPIVTLIHPRQTTVLVIREDTGGGGGGPLGNDRQATGGPVKLDAYKNDVLNALMVSGGLPGLRAKNEIRIYRRPESPLAHSVILDPSEFPEGSQWSLAGDELLAGPETTIPMRIRRGTTVNLAPEDVLLNEGDVVYIANRDTEVFYTAGLLPGGEHLMPRDYDIDIFEAMAIAGYSYGTPQAGGGGGGITPQSTGVAPTDLFIFRERSDGTEYTIEIDLERAIRCDRDRLLIKPGDKLFLRYSPKEELVNFGVFTFFTFGIRELFN